jgi:hypothetical protein
VELRTQSTLNHMARITGALTLSEYPGDVVRLTCEKCGRSGQYRKQSLIERYGADIGLPDLREQIAQCERARKMHDACPVRYVGLT